MNTRLLVTTLVVLAFSAALVSASRARDSRENVEGKNRKGKAFGSVFQLIRFENDACDGTGNRNGTCYTAEECEDLGGTDSGSCADGFGVCCTFTEGCGASSSQNCTYFEETSSAAGACNMDICPCGDNICQYRLDFNTFVIDGPSTSTSQNLNVLAGVPSTNNNANSASTQTRCEVDTFQVTGGATSPPVICGTNTGEHMYVDADEDCNTLAFNFGSSSSSSRNFQIKVTQYNCDFSNLAPQGCTQYYFGATTNTVETYNFNGGSGSQLANQNQAICVRRERGECRICWTAVIATQFDISGPTNNPSPESDQDICCSYGTNGQESTGFDCLQIPGAETTAGVAAASKICGRANGLETLSAGAMTAGVSVCSTSTPFLIRHISDGFEYNQGDNREGSAAPNDRGFRLAYIMDSTNC